MAEIIKWIGYILASILVISVIVAGLAFISVIGVLLGAGFVIFAIAVIIRDVVQDAKLQRQANHRDS